MTEQEITTIQLFDKEIVLPQSTSLEATEDNLKAILSELPEGSEYIAEVEKTSFRLRVEGTKMVAYRNDAVFG